MWDYGKYIIRVTQSLPAHVSNNLMHQSKPDINCKTESLLEH